jgi:hypothetical protein
MENLSTQCVTIFSIFFVLHTTNNNYMVLLKFAKTKSKFKYFTFIFIYKNELVFRKMNQLILCYY